MRTTRIASVVIRTRDSHLYAYIFRYEDMAGSGNFETMDDLETYAEYSQSSLLYLLLEAMGIKHEKLEFAASHVGVCKGIVTLLRGHEAHRQQVRKGGDTTFALDVVISSAGRWIVVDQKSVQLTYPTHFLDSGVVLLPERGDAEARLANLRGASGTTHCTGDRRVAGRD